MTDLKERLKDGTVSEYTWLETKEMVTDGLTKERMENKYLKKIVVLNKLEANDKINIVRCKDDKIKMTRILVSL